MARTYETKYEISEEQAAWFRAVKQTRKEKGAPKVLGSMNMGQYQKMFKLARKRTSSSPAGLHYIIWKAMAEYDYLADFQCVMLSLPFIYGFVCKRWLKGIDVMIEKKKGIRWIHTLQMMELLEADFNSALKKFFAKGLKIAAEKMIPWQTNSGAYGRIGHLLTRRR